MLGASELFAEPVACPFVARYRVTLFVSGLSDCLGGRIVQTHVEATSEAAAVREAVSLRYGKARGLTISVREILRS